jgi:hypothetical protein
VTLITQTEIKTPIRDHEPTKIILETRKAQNSIKVPHQTRPGSRWQRATSPRRRALGDDGVPRRTTSPRRRALGDDLGDGDELRAMVSLSCPRRQALGDDGVPRQTTSPRRRALGDDLGDGDER